MNDGWFGGWLSTPYRGHAIAAPPELCAPRIVHRDVKPANAEGHARLAWPAVVRSFA